MASSLGLSLGKANYCLRALIARGLVKAVNYRNSNNKLSYLYLLTPAGIAAKSDMTRQFLARKMTEFEALRLEIEQLKVEAGRGVPDAAAGDVLSAAPMVARVQASPSTSRQMVP